jgi:hypothetical protein
MTRKDYVKVAEILNAYKDEVDTEIFADLVSDFKVFFKSDNANFNNDRFESAVMK